MEAGLREREKADLLQIRLPVVSRLMAQRRTRTSKTGRRSQGSVCGWGSPCRFRASGELNWLGWLMEEAELGWLGWSIYSRLTSN